MVRNVLSIRKAFELHESDRAYPFFSMQTAHCFLPIFTLVLFCSVNSEELVQTIFFRYLAWEFWILFLIGYLWSFVVWQTHIGKQSKSVFSTLILMSQEMRYKIWYSQSLLHIQSFFWKTASLLHHQQNNKDAGLPIVWVWVNKPNQWQDIY